MTTTNDKQQPTTFVAIDIAKFRHEVMIEPPGQKRYRLTILNERAEHDRLIDHLRSCPAPVAVCFEPTGDYHRAIAWRLVDAGFDVSLISSVAFARMREAIHNSWDKNDPKDAQVMLHMIKSGNVMRYVDPLVHHTNDWQELSKTHEAISKAKTEVLHRLMSHYYPLYFPEIDRYRHNSRSDWFFRFLERFPIPASITVLSEPAFLAEAWDLIGRKVNKTRLLSDIYATAQTSVGLPVEIDSAAVSMYRLVIRQMHELIQQRDEVERHARELLGGHGDFQRLQQIPGIGPIHALTILAEAGDLRRFGHYRQFLKFCGFNLSSHQSGQFRGQHKLSKFGNARLRRTFWMAGQVAIRGRENTFRDKYQRYIRRDPDNRDLIRKALTAVAAKMATVTYSMIKHETDYRPFHGVR